MSALDGRVQRDGTWKAPSRLSVIESDAVEVLRTRGQFASATRARLDARYYLMHCQGWTKAEVDAAQGAENGE